MEHEIAPLVETLRQTESMYERLLTFIEMEKQAVLASNVNQLTTAAAEKQNVISRLIDLERQRRGQLQRLAEALFLPPSALNLSTLAAKFDPSHRGQLREAQQRLANVVSRVNHANEECRMLIRHCLRLVQNALSFFQHCADRAEVYGASGDMCGTKRGGGLLVSGCV